MSPTLRFDSKKQRVWFVSDLHYGHGKPFIIDPRGYKTLNEAMTDTIHKWKQYISPNDIVFNLGDQIVGAGENTTKYVHDLLALPCAHQYFVWGNHNSGVNDLYNETMKAAGYADGVEVYPLNVTGRNFTYLGHQAEISIDGQRVVLNHYPIASWNHVSKGSFMLHGHCHRNLKEDLGLKRLDIGWDWKRRPVEWNEIVAELSGRKMMPVDHHGSPEFIENEKQD